MKDLIKNYREVAERSSGCLALSVLHMFVLVVLLKRILTGHLAVTELVIAFMMVIFIFIGLIIVSKCITLTIHEVVKTLSGRMVMYTLYYIVSLGTVLSGIVTAGVKLS